MFTLFFAGRDLAPRCVINGQNIQDFLQNHYIDAFVELAKAIAAYENGSLLDTCVIGWDSLNEPSPGFIGLNHIGATPAEQQPKLGTVPTAFESMQLGMGRKVILPYYHFGTFGPIQSKTKEIDPKGISVWSFAHDHLWQFERGESWQETCVWAQHGVWELGADAQSDRILLPAYFSASGSSAASRDFMPTYWKAHVTSYFQAIRKIHPEAILFIQPPVFEVPSALSETLVQDRACLSTHFYDGSVIFLTLIS